MMITRRKGRMWERLRRTRRSPGFENTLAAAAALLAENDQEEDVGKEGWLTMMKLGHREAAHGNDSILLRLIQV